MTHAQERSQWQNAEGKLKAAGSPAGADPLSPRNELATWLSSSLWGWSHWGTVTWRDRFERDAVRCLRSQIKRWSRTRRETLTLFCCQERHATSGVPHAHFLLAPHPQPLILQEFSTHLWAALYKRCGRSQVLLYDSDIGGPHGARPLMRYVAKYMCKDAYEARGSRMCWDFARFFRGRELPCTGVFPEL